MPAVRIKDVGKLCKQGIVATGDCECDRDGSDRLAVGAVDASADNRTKRALLMGGPGDEAADPLAPAVRLATERRESDGRFAHR